MRILLATLGLTLMIGPALLVLADGASTKPSTQPSTQAASRPVRPSSVSDVSRQIPKDLWPNSTSDKQKDVRDAFIKEKLRGEKVTLTLSVTMANEIGVNGKQSGVSLCGNTADMLVYCFFPTEGYTNLKGHKVGDTVTVIGELEKIHVGGVNAPVGNRDRVGESSGVLKHAITLKACEIAGK